MADPILDEEGIKELMRVPVKAEHVHMIQAGCAQALIDLYDRKVTREEFSHMASPIIALYAQTAKLWMLASIEMVHDAGDLDKRRFELARDGLEDLIRKQCESVIEVVKRLQQCPTSQDAVH